MFVHRPGRLDDGDEAHEVVDLREVLGCPESVPAGAVGAEAAYPPGRVAAGPGRRAPPVLRGLDEGGQDARGPPCRGRGGSAPRRPGAGARPGVAGVLPRAWSWAWIAVRRLGRVLRVDDDPVEPGVTEHLGGSPAIRSAAGRPPPPALPPGVPSGGGSQTPRLRRCGRGAPGRRRRGPRCSAAQAARLREVSAVAPAMWVVTTTLGRAYTGSVGSGGSFPKTSRPAPPIRPARSASDRASSSTRAPRATLIRQAEGFIRASLRASIRCRVLSFRGRCRAR